MKKSIYISFSVIALAGIWVFFRPELVFVTTSVDEKLSDMSAEPLLFGRFQSVAHHTEGVATIYKLSDSRRLLRLSEFQTSNGPDVHVTLVASNDAADSATVREAGFVSLGKLKGTEGDQNYELPAELDLSEYGAVTIWCHRFSVNFGTASLSPMAPVAP